jgi:5-methylcytosine-specific restriction endonuclease McrA
VSGPNAPRGTTNRNQRGNTADRRARRQWLLDTFGDGTTAPCMIKWDGHCQKVVDETTLTVDRHPVPGIDGGTYAYDNIRPACGPCNSRAGTALREERKTTRVRA